MIEILAQNYTKPLKTGDEVLIVATSSAIEEEEDIVKGLEILSSWGLICRSQKFVGRKWRYLAGDDELRFQELHSDSIPPLIICARGGWGAARLLEREQPWEPGWLVGFSDVSSLLLSRLSSGFDGGIHGPLLTSLANEPKWSQERLRSILFGEEVSDLYGEVWNKGIASGPLVVCNLSVGTHLIGSSHMPDLKGAILILEDVGEAPYRIDRMLTHLRLAGILQNLAGLGFGNFVDCEPKENIHPKNEYQLSDILKERCLDLDIPVLGKLPIGHSIGNAAIPLGRQGRLDGENGSLSLIPS